MIVFVFAAFFVGIAVHQPAPEPVATAEALEQHQTSADEDSSDAMIPDNGAVSDENK